MSLSPTGILLLLLTLGLAYGTALAFEHIAARRGFFPPLLATNPEQRWKARLVLAGILWIAVFASFSNLAGGGGPEPDLSNMNPAKLFLLHGLLILSLVAWLMVAFGRFDASRFVNQLGLRPPKTGSSRLSGLAVESVLGVAAGIVAWVVTIVALVFVALVVSAVAGQDAVPQKPPALIPFIVGLPIWIRLLIAVSAGVVEETFFRGFLQPRMGIALSTICFALAHASYQNPIMLVGVTILSLIFAALVRWRRNLWAAIVAHFVFDAVQLLVIVPNVLKLMPGA